MVYDTQSNLISDEGYYLSWMLKSIHHQYARWLNLYFIGCWRFAAVLSAWYVLWRRAHCWTVQFHLKFSPLRYMKYTHTHTHTHSLTYNGRMITIIRFMIKIGCTYMLRSIKYNLIISTHRQDKAGRQASKQTSEHARHGRKKESNKMNRFCSCKSIIMEHTN